MVEVAPLPRSSCAAHCTKVEEAYTHCFGLSEMFGMKADDAYCTESDCITGMKQLRRVTGVS